MNNFNKAALRFVSSASMRNVFGGKRDFTRTLWHMSKNPENSAANQKSSILGERELVEFLTEEILAERKAQKIKTVATTLEGYAVKLNGAEMELTKQLDKEKVVISFNVNHTVDTEEEAEISPTSDKPDMGEMRSKPQFEVDIVKGGTTLSFTCSFLEGTAQDGEYNDVFGIDEMTIYEGEWNEKVYAVAGDVLDGYLYDLLMNLLEEKGISNEFVEKMSDLATAYEHSSYIGLLESLSKFTTGK